MKINYYQTQEFYPFPEFNPGVPLEYLTGFTQGILDETIKDSEYILYFKEENKEFEYKKHFTSEQELIDIISNAHKFLDIFKQTQENEINK